MEITLIGFILMPFGVLLFLFKPGWLFYSFIFFIPFFATAVLNVQSISFGVTPAHFFALLWVTRRIIDNLTGKAFYLHKKSNVVLGSLLLFLFVISLSLIMPVVIAGETEVYKGNPLMLAPVAHEFTFSNVSVFLFLAFAVLMTIFVSLEINSPEKFKRSIKVFLISAFTVSIWGFLQLLTHYAGLPYPAFLFNNSISDAIVSGPIAEAEGASRIFSVTPEPSVFARYLLAGLPLALILMIKKIKVFSSAFILPCFVFAYILALILTVSTSAYFGLGFMAIAAFFFLRRYKDLSPFLRIAAMFLLALGAVVSVNPEMFDNTLQMTVFKALTFSGMERIFAFQEALGLFSAYPLLGVGWGSNASFDLISYLLANSGLFGALCFALFVLSAYKHFRWLQKNNNIGFETKAYTDGIGLSLLTGIFLNLTGGLDLVFLHLWFLLGLMLSLSKIISLQTTKDRGYNEI
ncbi:MAG: hypothetical protein FD169_955 [Bacillota bacterium]|nr:MAG: hypothetical protein FD169_955 [Bacillota bacterium]